jgi:hypothetical protein
MGKGKYKRKRQKADNEANQSQPSPSLVDEKRSQELKEKNSDHSATSSGTQENPTWYFRLWGWIRRDYVSSVSIAVFTGVLAAVSIGQGCVTRKQLIEMQKAQRPFVYTTPNLGSNWLSDTEHDMAITMVISNASAFPALRVVTSTPKIVMATPPQVDSEIGKCEVSYPDDPTGEVLAPVSAGPSSAEALMTVHTSYIYDKERIKQSTDQVVVYGGVKYSGISGGEFETRYCYTYLPEGDFRFGPCRRCVGMK